MRLWYTEQHTDHVRFSIQVNRQLFSGHSAFQRIDVFESYEFGRILVLDGYLMVTEKDEFVYHDMIVHVPMATNKAIQDVLVIGAGDGGAIRELTRYGVRRIDMVEIDQMVVDVCKQYLPSTAGKLDDPRVRIHYEDGLKFVRTKQDAYDLILVDSTDPFGPGEGLFTKEFYGNCYNALRADGILVNQHESPFYAADAMAMSRAHRCLLAVFPLCRVYQAHIPTYPSGHWLFGYSSKGRDPVRDLDADWWASLGLHTKYYNTALHRGCFDIPTYVKELLEDDDGQ